MGILRRIMESAEEEEEENRLLVLRRGEGVELSPAAVAIVSSDIM
jgi:hypothetical protein